MAAATLRMTEVGEEGGCTRPAELYAEYPDCVERSKSYVVSGYGISGPFFSGHLKF